MEANSDEVLRKLKSLQYFSQFEVGAQFAMHACLKCILSLSPVMLQRKGGPTPDLLFYCGPRQSYKNKTKFDAHLNICKKKVQKCQLSSKSVNVICHDCVIRLRLYEN